MNIVSGIDNFRREEQFANTRFVDAGVISAVMLGVAIRMLKAQSVGELRAAVASGKCSWTLIAIPEWWSCRPLKDMNCAEAGPSLRRWMLGEHCLGVETSIFRRLSCGGRVCKLCLEKENISVIGGEVHALGRCARAGRLKMDCMVEFLGLIFANDYGLELESGNVSDISGLLHKEATQLHGRLWKLLSLLMEAIDKAVEAEDPHKVKRRPVSSRIRLPIRRRT